MLKAALEESRNGLDDLSLNFKSKTLNVIKVMKSNLQNWCDEDESEYS
jgi:hypothetical protein